MSLDTRARHAVRSLQDGVVRVIPSGMPAVNRRHRVSLLAGLVGALAIFFASMALASMLPDTEPGDTANVNPSLIPDPEIPDGELVVLPEHGGGDIEEGIHQTNATSDNHEPYTQFYGTAEPGTIIVAYSPYGTADLEVGESGEFSLKLWFDGAPSGVTFPVTLTVGDVEHVFDFTWLWDPQNIALTAHQTYGSSDSAAPYEKFFGTAPPGTAVSITSEYGRGNTVVGENGEWYLKVWFVGQPAGESFNVTVNVGDETFTFPFLWLHEGGSGEISVTQQGTSSTSSSPYTRFVGTAPAGTHVLATSEYGSADLEVGESGEFNLKVWFSGAPAGDAFPITLKINHEYYATYYFTSNWNPGPVEFTIHQYNTESESAEPWVKFYGTATPGTEIHAYSDYGSVEVEVGSSGEYLFKLYFSTLPPAGQEFPVHVKVNGSFYGSFPFTSWHDGTVGLTVNQHNTESDSPEPYIKFYGTATPGTVLFAYSDYGSEDIVVGESGEFLFKVYFSPLPPAGQQFQVNLKVNGSFYGAYNFTSWHDGTVELTVNQPIPCWNSK